MGKYCCFFCPKEDFTEKEMDEPCPSCGRPFGFPLQFAPDRIESFAIERALGRGFYGAAYVVKRTVGLIPKRYVLKICPKSFYTYFKKRPFEEEVRLHNEMAENAAHVVAIHDAFVGNVTFSDAANTSLECNITVLDYINGDLLKEYVSGSIPVTAALICQLAIDLLSLRHELESSKLNHNDLHLENLIVEKLGLERMRSDAIDGSVRVKAIDLASLADESKSNATRIGDITFIANHVSALTQSLIAQPNTIDDREYRAALALQAIAQSMSSGPENLRIPNYSDLIDQIRLAFFRASHPWRPWKEPLALKNFADHYNAQTLDSWYVPSLLVDPGLRWHKEVTKPGPQIITGMRGCGKTMLLRALDIHARAGQHGKEDSGEILTRVRKDKFVGLFLSAQRLLDLRAQSVVRLERRLTRLYLGYSLQAARALIHLSEVDAKVIAPGAHKILASAVSDYLSGATSIEDPHSLDDLEQRLLKLLVLTIGNEEDSVIVRESPSQIFTHLAEQLRRCAEVFQNCTIYFLLDDVSTRYLALDSIAQLFSALLFQSPICAFKFTSEWQTIELGLRSPGRIHPVRVDRDLTVFDLGGDVLEKITAPGAGGKSFVREILEHRTKMLASPSSPHNPKDILGDVPLEQVAREIAETSATSSERKKLYRGLSCLTNVCVGDIGDVIKIYEAILRRGAEVKTIPLPDHIQSSCFRDMSVRRLYDLDRRAHDFKAHALAFAEVSHELLVRSAKNEARLRQYSLLYVRVTSEDEHLTTTLIDQLRDLIDAGVFVFAGGAPRSKTRDSNPMQQFILSFRKIYGLTAFMGLADRDRFELSGDDLRAWLEDPSKGKEILLRNQIRREVEGTQTSGSAGKSDKIGSSTKSKSSKSRKPWSPVPDLFGISSQSNEDKSLPPSSIAGLVDVRELTMDEVKGDQPDLVYSGLGFEERTRASNLFLASSLLPRQVHLVKYRSVGYGEDILKHWNSTNAEVVVRRYSESIDTRQRADGTALVDVSGLTKPLIFNLIRNNLMSKGRVLVCHAAAASNYPLEEDVAQLFTAETLEDPIALLESLDTVLRGEYGPYSELRLLKDKADPTRSRALIAFASSKHERLFSLLDRREFDHLEIIVPEGDSPRSRVANIAANLLAQDYCDTKVSKWRGADLPALVNLLDRCFMEAYTSGSDVEIGLTGSKLQAVAAAALSAVRRVSQAWYLSPRKFDEKRFSRGVGEIRLFEIKLKQP